MKKKVIVLVSLFVVLILVSVISVMKVKSTLRGARINGTEIPIGFRIITRILRVLYVLFISPFFNRSIKG